MPQEPTISDLFPIPPEVKRFGMFLGEWNARGSVSLDGTTLAASGAWRITWAAGGQGLRINMKISLGPLGDYEEDDLVGYDAETGRLHIFRLTNTAAVIAHQGEWLDERTLKTAYVRHEDGRIYHEEMVLSVHGPASFTVNEVDRYGDSIVSSMSFSLTKTGGT